MDPEKSRETEVTVDDILHILGPFGKFNVFNYLLILFPVLLAGMYSSVYNFEAMDLKYRCAIPECVDQEANFTAPYLEDGSPAKCMRYAPFVNFTSNENKLNDTCAPHFFDTSTEVKCDSYIYFEEHSIVKEVILDLPMHKFKEYVKTHLSQRGYYTIDEFLNDKVAWKHPAPLSSLTR
ncbi:jg10140 [Pararge aegeria aegeria]|uniref:Jg10140 protein n=1 Tax=Pararge aegeria aegeria TaxID=348720 RepID=A0A8S4R7D5_9NEOP|nr:jg10140 [Pararge aegeria aegeria]